MQVVPMYQSLEKLAKSYNRYGYGDSFIGLNKLNILIKSAGTLVIEFTGFH